MQASGASFDVSSLGAVEATRNCFRAHVQYRDDTGNKHICGPRRGEKRRAEEDIMFLRAAAPRNGGRTDALAAMEAEARRLQERAEFEARVALAGLHLDRAAASSEEGSDPGGLLELDEDVSEPWQMELDEMLSSTSLAPEDIVVVPNPSTPVEATALLVRFRPARSSLEDLKKLLSARADPNVTPGPGDISPLRNVLTFAPKRSVAAMREALLDHGAKQSKFEYNRWLERQSADACEEAWLRKVHDDPR